MSEPEVSVVMSVFNDAATLPRTLESVLGQQGCDLEFIVIDDGSTDGSGNILDEWARQDARLRPLHQGNIGLTRALIRGCAQARGQFIARQDAGDLSLPGRLAAQAQRLREGADYAAVTCHAQFFGPGGEALYRSEIAEEALNAGLSDPHAGLRGPAHHGSVMMKKSAYERAGGYRAAFYFAQDLDLWSRIVEHGRFGVVDATLYQALLLPGSISGTRAAEQRQLASLIELATETRRAGKDEAEYLAAAALVVPGSGEARTNRLAQGNYFIGSCLRQQSPAQAQTYFREALRHDPWHWRAWLRLLQTKAGL